MHLFIQGKPGEGKTTFIKKLIKFIDRKRGFYTEEIREGKERKGFKVVTLKDREVVFAHKDFVSPYKVSHYGVDVEKFEQVAVEELKQGIESSCKVLFIDEIGKMELFSSSFRRVVEEAMEKKRVVATIPQKTDFFIERLKERKDVCCWQLERGRIEEMLYEAKLFLESLPVEEIRSLEKRAKQIGLEERILIENAGSNLAYEVEKLGLGKRVLVVAGKGNNGADVLSCARKLLSRNYEVDIVVLREKPLGEEVRFQLSVLEKINASLQLVSKEKELSKLRALLKEVDFVVEGILGIGIKGELSPFLKKVIEEINGSGKIVVSCDIPSGLSPQEGKGLPIAIKAQYTITFLAPKEGFFINEGPYKCGKIIVRDIGISQQKLAEGCFS